MTTNLLLALAIGYVFGSIPFGLVLTRLAGTEDIRTIGSGNIGATNVLRTGRKGLAAGTLLLDALKGTAGVLVGGWLAGPAGALAGGLGAFLGHLFPVWLGFKGGKGVATYLGTLLGLDWRLFLGFAGIWLAVAFATRYSSAAALAASALTPVVGWALGAGMASVAVLTLLAGLLLRKAELSREFDQNVNSNFEMLEKDHVLLSIEKQ